jgi:hypothetical protein
MSQRLVPLRLAYNYECSSRRFIWKDITDIMVTVIYYTSHGHLFVEPIIINTAYNTVRGIRYIGWLDGQRR